MMSMHTLADAAKVDELISLMSHTIANDIQSRDPGSGWALVGIRSRGDILAKRIATKLGNKAIDGRVGSLDITLYRDDLSEIGSQAVVQTTDIPFNIDGLNIVLIDDVLMTGRSVRAALQSLIDLGRPHRVWLNVLVDRGGRELPIQPDFAALDINKASDTTTVDINTGDRVDVRLMPTDDCDAVIVQSASSSEDLK